MIDDDPGMRSLMQRGLRLAGYNVNVAHNGEAGIIAAARRRPDLVLLDLMMPGMGGFATLARLQTMDSPPKVIVISGRDEADDLARAGAADRFLVKPVAFDALLEAVSAVLREPPASGTEAP
ncbi:MAG: response regulator [Meiothermus sp.]|nr:response regulator [Meiothermus sp.]